jgi:signal transduction histidine kinase
VDFSLYNKLLCSVICNLLSQNLNFMTFNLKLFIIYFCQLSLIILFGCNQHKELMDTKGIASDIYGYRINSQMDSAVIYCANILGQANENQNSELIGIIYETVGIANLDAEKYKEAISCFEKAIVEYHAAKLAEDATRLELIVLNDKYLLSGDHEIPISFIDSLNNKFQLKIAGNPNLGDAYNLFIDMYNATSKLNDVDTAYLIYNKIKYLLPSTNDKSYYCQSVLMLAVHYWNQGLVDSLISLSDDISNTLKNHTIELNNNDDINVILWVANFLSGHSNSNIVLSKPAENKLVRTFLKDSIFLNLIKNNVIILSDTSEFDNRYMITLSKYLDKQDVTYLHSLNFALNQFKFTELLASYLEAENEKKSWRFTVLIILFVVIIASLLSYLLFFKWKSSMALRENITTIRMQIMEKELVENELNLMETIRKVQNAERQKIASDMHDGITNTLVGLRLFADNMLNNKVNEKHVNNESWQLMVKNLNIVVEELRSYSHALDSKGFLPQGIERALKDYLHIYKKCHDFSITEEGVGICEKLSASRQYQLFRILQELVSNSIKYAGATKITLLFKPSLQSLNITYINNRFVVSKNGDKQGIGEHSIHYRLNELNAFNISEIKTPDLFTFEFNLPLLTEEV